MGIGLDQPSQFDVLILIYVTIIIKVINIPIVDFVGV